MTTVVVSAYHVANFPETGGHFWVYVQYALGLLQAGCDVYWLERFALREPGRDRAVMEAFLRRMDRVGLGGRVILLVAADRRGPLDECSYEGGLDAAEAQAVFGRAELLLNFDYRIDPGLLARFRRTALVDVDPGLLQIWMQQRQLEVAPHDVWLTTGETVGVAGSRVPDAGREWHRIRPCVSLAHWPVVYDDAPAPMSTVSSWDAGEWVREGEQLYENNKRLAFLEYRELPRRVSQPLELAVCHRPDEQPELDTMRAAGWRIRHSRDVAGSPEAYRDYVQRARGEFSCAKPSYVRLRTAWVSDRTLCYLASGKPAVVQHTGPSADLPEREGLFRFSNVDEAAAAIDAVNADYRGQCRAARALAEEFFDARKVASRILEVALGSRR